ncbi:hypothetical protein OWM54_12355 [Myxococcus sp. MISCRS1]|uniref:hypothetical protein n=1 Tax=Myxococcus sp. MISCRS1 TaxID=2996786 RepID=UPI00226DC135|nr:hypothetical protein [Myxococcus sp. MISCRS1]MCY0997921.1 hypothetical protein [Myxococcus sp. MISCRS1]
MRRLGETVLVIILVAAGPAWANQTADLVEGEQEPAPAVQNSDDATRGSDEAAQALGDAARELGKAAQVLDNAAQALGGRKPPPPPGKPRLTLDDIKGGMLFRHGFSFGVGFQAHLPRTSGRQGSAGFGLVPFVSLFPATWFIADETSTYCASRWGGFGKDEARGIANSVARARTTSLTGDKNPSDAEVQRVTNWDVEKPGAWCWRQWIGLYVGVPSKFKADAALGDDVAETVFTEFNPIFSGGVIFSPSTYFSVLGGLTRSRIAANGSPSHPVTSVSIGLGGSIEIVGLLIGK